MNRDEELELAIKIATKAHEGQFRRDGVTPYIEHPKAVADKFTDTRLKSIAWLHDVIEDSDQTELSLLEAGISHVVADAVNVLSRHEGQSYGDYIKWVKSDALARKVKIADMLTNLTDTPTPRQVERYTKGVLFLC